MTSVNRYSGTAIALHWLTALLIFAAWPLGMVMTGMPLSPLKLKLFSYHKWLGVTVFVLALAHLAWRARHAPPALPASIAPWQQRAAHGLHAALYLLLLAIPLSGWLMSSAKGFQTIYLGVLPLPDLVGKNKALGEILENIHTALNYGLLAVLAGHIGSALKHQYLDRDGVLARMLPFLDKENSK